MIERAFTYSLKLFDGRLIHADGADWLAAAKAARIKPELVKRHMPVKALPTVAEIEKKAAADEKRAAALKGHRKEKALEQHIAVQAEKRKTKQSPSHNPLVSA
jgi:hypothetical protein